MEKLHIQKQSFEGYCVGTGVEYPGIIVHAKSDKDLTAEFLQALPCERVAYCHVAGHYNEAEDLIVDTHGADVIDPVWDILDKAYELFGNMPTLLERDFNFPPIDVLMQEVHIIRNLQNKWDDSQQAVAKAS